MSQTFTDDPYEQSYVADTSLVNYENNDLALKSMFSGAAAPSNLVAFMPWGDTAKGLKRRNNDNTAWLVILSGDANQKMYVYRNDTCEGWLIDATVTDRVLAVKGGVNAYNVNGGVNAGTWTQPGHTLTAAEIPAHTHISVADSHGHAFGGVTPQYFTSGYAEPGDSGSLLGGGGTFNAGETNVTIVANSHNHLINNNTGGGGSHNHGDTHRPAAAVGTLQYPDL